LKGLETSNEAPSGLAHAALDKIYGVFDRHPEVHTVKLYGSRAKGTFNPSFSNGRLKTEKSHFVLRFSVRQLL